MFLLKIAAGSGFVPLAMNFTGSPTLSKMTLVHHLLLQFGLQIWINAINGLASRCRVIMQGLAGSWESRCLLADLGQRKSLRVAALIHGVEDG